MRFLIAFLVSAAAWGQITHDTRTVTGMFFQTSPITWSFTAPSCKGSFVISLVGRTNNNVTITAMTYGGAAANGSGTLVTSGSTGIQYFYWVSPPAGSATMSGAMSTTTGYAGAMGVTRSYCGVNQSTPIDTVASAVTSTGNPGISITPTRANTWAIDAIFAPTDSGYGNTNGTWTNAVSSRNGLSMFSSDTGPIATVTQVTSSWNAPYHDYVLAALTLVPDILCSITTTSLPSASVGAEYSQRIGTTHCSAPAFSVSTGALPDGLALDSATGMITGTPTTTSGGSPLSFKVAVTDASGNDSKDLGITVMAALPVITSGPTCVANSPWSIKVTWTTDVVSSSQVQAGTNPGGPYTAYQTPVVYTGTSVTPGTPGAPFGGVTSHSMVIAGLPTNSSPTAYYLQALSYAAGGATMTSNPISCGTKEAAPSTRISATFGPHTRYNDQDGGFSGMPNNGRALSGDTCYWTAWADDGKLYGMCNDTQGVASGGPYKNSGNLLFFSTSAASATPAAAVDSLLDVGVKNTLSNFGVAGQTNTNGWTDNGTWKSGNCISFFGKIVCPIMRQDGALGGFANSSLIVSSDHGATWLSPQNWPNGAPQAGGDPPTGTGGFSGHAMFPGGGAPAHCANITFPQHGQDYGGTNPGSFVAWGGTDAWVYAFCRSGDWGVNTYAARIRIEDFLLLDTAKWQFYTGGNGLLDVNWSSSLGAAIPIPGLAGCAQGVDFVPDFNGYLFSCGVNAGPPTFTAVMFTAPFPWGCVNGIAGCTADGGVNFAGSVPRISTHLSFAPGWPTPLISTYRAAPASSIVVHSSGSCSGSINNDPPHDSYSPFWWDVRLSPYSAGPEPAVTSYRASSRKVVSDGLRLYFPFQGDMSSVNNNYNGSTVVKDHGPLKPSYSTPVTVGGFPFEDSFGYMFGLANPDCNQLYASAATRPILNNPLTTAFQETLQDFTIAVSFAHYPTGTLAGSVGTGFPLVSNESVFGNGTDLKLERAGTNGNSWKVTVGGTTSSAFPLATDAVPTSTGAVTFPLLFIVRRGTTVSVYSSAGITDAPPLTTLTTFADGTQLGQHPLVLGSTLLGIMPHFAIWNRALGDGVNGPCELCVTTQSIRALLSVRRITIP